MPTLNLLLLLLWLLKKEYLPVKEQRLILEKYVLIHVLWQDLVHELLLLAFL